MKIIDNFLTIKEQNLIHGIILSKEFGWRFKPYTTDESDFVSIKKNKHNLKIKDSSLFYHIFYVLYLFFQQQPPQSNQLL